jgi:diacylglycerol kinase family enzyme
MSSYPIPVATDAPRRASRSARRLGAAGRRHVVLVANGRASGIGRARERLGDAERLLRGRGVRVETHVTASQEELAASVAFDERRVVLLGGDGTVHAAANLATRPGEIAILPAGRANNVARALGVPLDLAAAATLAAEGSTKALDLISAASEERRYLAVEGVSVGLHALARARYRAPNSADTWAAVRTGLQAVRRFGGVSLCVSSDGAAEMITVGQLFVANLPLFAFGLRVAPAALADDGLLDVVALPWTGRARILPMLARLRRGTHLARADTRAWTARRVRIATRGRSPVIADTTNLGTGPVTLDVVPAALSVVAP